MRSSVPILLILLLSACGDAEPLMPPDALLPDGGRYRGSVVDGLLQGEGRLDYANGSWFQGRFVDGLLHGHGQWHGGAGEHYAGEFRQGLFHGQGRLRQADGTVYQGGFKRGLMHGEGTLERPAERYSGGFSGNLYQGYGRLEREDGSSHQGRFVRGLADGEGLLVDAEGNQFAGHFRKGLLQGEGSFRSPAGDVYNGTFKDGDFAGPGRYQSADDRVWMGRFKAGELSGVGEFSDIDGSRYRGSFRRWEFSGQGELSLADGSHYRGGFVRGKYSGNGELSLPDGRREAGEWRQGRRLRDEAGRWLADPLELGLLQQGQLLEEALAEVPASTPAVELYTLTVAGDGQQSVFLREVDYVSELLAQRFAAHGQITLVNHREQMTERPLATRENLRQAIQTLATRMGEEDLAFIYLTSHGTAGHQLVLDQPGLELSDMPAAELAQLLEPLHERNKVLVISACYSGGFIPLLADDRTLVMTAARADRVSFGCSEEAEFTYFGRALFAEALHATDDLQVAFDLASRAVAKREQEDDFPASEPQISSAPAVLSAWQELLHHAPADRLLASAPEWPENNKDDWNFNDDQP